MLSTVPEEFQYRFKDFAPSQIKQDWTLLMTYLYLARPPQLNVVAELAATSDLLHRDLESNSAWECALDNPTTSFNVLELLIKKGAAKSSKILQCRMPLVF